MYKSATPPNPYSSNAAGTKNPELTGYFFAKYKYGLRFCQLSWGYLQLQISNERQTTLQLQIVSQDGKVVSSSSFAAAAGTISRSVHISNLAKGTYFLKVTSIHNEEQVMKFEKQ